MIDDDVVNAYLGLLANKCHYSGTRVGVGATHSGFWTLLSSPRRGGWQDSHRHLNKDYRVNLVPTFFGSQNSGHWAALIIDSECSPGQQKFAFVDSIAFLRSGNFSCVKRLLGEWVGDDSNFVLIDSPSQAAGSNDCAVYTLAACAHWVLREGSFLPSKFVFQNGIDPERYGRAWRHHVHKSIVNGKIDMRDQCLHWMVLQN